MTSLHRLLPLFLLLISLAWSGGCTTMGVQMKADLAVHEPKQEAPTAKGQVEYVTSIKTYGHAVACWITGIFYGGWCWSYLAMPFDYQKLEVREQAVKGIEKKINNGSISLSDVSFMRLDWALEDETLRLSPNLIPRVKGWESWLNQDFDDLVKVLGAPEKTVFHADGRTHTMVFKNTQTCLFKVKSGPSNKIYAIEIESSNKAHCQETFPNPPEKSAVISPSKEGSGGLSSQEVQATIRANLSQIRNCYEALLESKKEASGKIKIKLGINAEGRTQNAQVIFDTVGNEQMRSCVLKKIDDWKWPKPRGGAFVDVTYPFLFNPR